MIDDAVSISCSYEDYLYLKKKRSNLFWDGNKKMMERYRKKIKLNLDLHFGLEFSILVVYFKLICKNQFYI